MTDIRQVQGIRVAVDNARGPSVADIARRTGAFDTLPADNDTVFLERFAKYAIERNPGFQSNIPGPSNNTRDSLAALKAAAISDRTSLYDGSLWTWSSGDYTGRADDQTIVESDYEDLTVGAWVRRQSKVPVYNLPDFRLAVDADDTAAFYRALEQIAARGGGCIRFPAGEGMGENGAYRISGDEWGLAITVSNLTLLGDGMDATVIERMDGAGSVIGGPGSAAFSVRIEHLTLRARGGGWCFHANGPFVYNDWIWTNVRFAGRKDIPSQNLFQMIGDNGGSASDWTFTDCIGQTCSRMGFEFQNHRDDITSGDRSSAFLSISFIRCSIVDIQAAPGIYPPGQSYPFGISFSGRCSDMTVVDAYFAGVQGTCIEGVGSSDVNLRNIGIFMPSMRPYPTGDYANEPFIRASGNRKMFNWTIDGLYPVTQANTSIEDQRPEIMRPLLRLDNVEMYDLSRIFAVRCTQEKAIEIGINAPSPRGRLRNSILGSFRYVVNIDGGSLDVSDSTLITYSSTPNEANGVRAWNNSGPCDVTLRNIRMEFNAGGVLLQLIGGATGYAVTRAAPASVSYIAPPENATTEQLRVAIMQLAADAESHRAVNRAAGLMRPAS